MYLFIANPLCTSRAGAARAAPALLVHFD